MSDLPLNSEIPTLYENIICLNDQGGDIMSVSYNIVGTLRSQMGGHAPIVLLYESSEEVKYG
jgi:hypothetical protein